MPSWNYSWHWKGDQRVISYSCHLLSVSDIRKLFLILQVIYALGFHNEAVGRIVACEQALHFQWKTRRAIRERASERQRPACRFRVSFRVTCARGFHEIPQRRWPL